MIFIFLISLIQNFNTTSSSVKKQSNRYNRINEKADPIYYIDRFFNNLGLLHPPHVYIINCTFQSNLGQGLYILYDTVLTINTIDSCIFKNCSSEDRGAIYFRSEGPSHTTFTNCTFISNNCTRNGGAICFVSSNFTFSSCTFKDNSLLSPSTTTASNTCRGGTACFQDSNGSLINCTFTNSQILSSLSSGNFFGGAIYTQNSCQEYEKCVFIDCFSHSILNQNRLNGGVFFTENSVCFIRDCNFTNNFVNSKGTDGESIGGAIASKTTNWTFEDCFFVNNTVYSNDNTCAGGALFFTNSNVEFLRTFFSLNSIQSSHEGSSCLGGAVFIQNSIFIMNDCNIINNFIEPLVNNMVISGGGFYFVNSEGVINGCFFISNSLKFASDMRGGCLLIMSSKVNMSDCVLSDNCIFCMSAYSTCLGGSLVSYNSDAFIYRCNFTNNSVLCPNYVCI